MPRGSSNDRGGATVGACLESIEVDTAVLSACSNVQEEFSCIKKAYFKKILACHPDKGGDPVVFRNVQGAFEVLRELMDTAAVRSFAGGSDQSMRTAGVYKGKMAGMAGVPTPSWEYYKAAAEEPVPAYRVELAKSGRSACVARGAAKKCGTGGGKKRKARDAGPEGEIWEPRNEKDLIGQGEVRVGSIDGETGAYGRWVHLRCWRVPGKVWLGLPAGLVAGEVETALLGMENVLLSGVHELSGAGRESFVRHAMDKSNWARLTARTKPAREGAAVSRQGGAPGSVAEVKDRILSRHGDDHVAFVAPVPGRGRAKPDTLAGETVVLTGVFPELGGGTGLNLGKARAKSMVQAFGGRVTGSVSGRTTILLVGKEPGFSKVSMAQSSEKCKLLSLRDLKGVLEGDRSLQALDKEPMVIESFSSGYRGNSLALHASPAALARASGTALPAIEDREGGDLKPEPPRPAASGHKRNPSAQGSAKTGTVPTGRRAKRSKC